MALSGKIVTEGDSLSTGFSEGTPQSPWPDILEADHPGLNVVNVAENAHTVNGNILGDATTQVDPEVQPGAPLNCCVLWAVTNDLDAGRTPAQGYADVETWCNGRRAAGFDQIIVINCIARDGLSQATIDTFNGLLAADHSFCDALIDAAGAVDDWDNNPSLWQADHIHLTTAGYDVISGLVASELEALMTIGVVQQAEDPDGAITLTGVVAGNTIVVFAANSTACSDNVNGSYGAAKGDITDGNAQTFQSYVLQGSSNAGGTLNITATSATAIWAIEVGGAEAASYSVQASQFQATPGTGTDAITSGNATPTDQPNLYIALSNESNDYNTAPAAGTGFSDSAAGWNFGLGGNAALLEWRRTTSTSADDASFTSNHGNVGHSTLAVVLIEDQGGAPPTIDSTTPSDNATGVARNASPAVTFDQNVVAGSGNFYIWNVTRDILHETIAVGSVSISTDTVTINPSQDFAYGEDYAITWDAGVVEADDDAAPVDELTDKTVWNFRTVEAPVEELAGLVIGSDASFVGEAFIGATEGDTSPGDGAISATSTVTATSQALAASPGSIAATSSVAGAGASLAEAAGSVACTSTVTAVSAALAASAGAISGSAACSAVGQSAITGAGSIACTSSVTATSEAFAASSGSAAATCSVTATGEALAASAGAISGTASVAAVGASLAAAAGSISGACTVSGAGESGTQGDGAISCAATVTGVSAALAESAGAISGACAVSGVGAALAAADGSVSCATSCVATSSATASSAGSITITSEVEAEGESAADGEGVGAISATLTATGVSSALAAATGVISITSSVSAASAGNADGAGAISSTSTVTGAGAALYSGAGAIAATSTVEAAGAAGISGAGAISVTSSVTGSTSALVAGAGAIACTSSQAATSAALAASPGAVACVCTVVGVGQNAIPPDPPRATFSIVDPDAPTASFAIDTEGDPSASGFTLAEKHQELPLAA